MISIIVAMSSDRVIGVNGSIPWQGKYPGDLRRFKEVTLGSTVVMGRKTWESIPAKFRPLEGRYNVVVTSDQAWPAVFGKDGRQVAHAERSIFHTLSPDEFSESSLVGGFLSSRDVWFIGGARIYAEAMQYADVIDVTLVPWVPPADWRDLGFLDKPIDIPGTYRAYSTAGGYHVAFFPPIDETVFAPGEVTPHPYEPELRLQRFERRYGLKDNELLRQ